MSPWTIIEYVGELQIHDLQGRSARLTKRTRIRSNHKGLTEFTHRNIRADGDVKNFRWDSRPVDTRDVEKKLGEYIVHERFHRPTSWMEVRESALAWDLHDSFLSNNEYFEYIPDYFTKDAKIDIRLPQNRPARRVEAFCGIGAERKALSIPTLGPNGSLISWSWKKLRPGQRYTIEWNW